MESNENKINFLERSSCGINKEKIVAIKEALKHIKERTSEDNAYDKEKIKALANQMDEQLFKPKDLSSSKIKEAFRVLYELVKTDAFVNEKRNNDYNNNNHHLGLELLNTFKNCYLPTIKDYSPVTKPSWHKEDNAALETKDEQNKKKEKNRRIKLAEKHIKSQTVSFLISKAVDAHFKEIDRAEKELPIDDETKTIIETARQILQKIDEENEPSNNDKEKRFNEFLNRAGIAPSLEQAEKKAKSEAQESLFDKIASNPFHASDRKSILSMYEQMHGGPAPDSFVNALDVLIKHAPPLAPSKNYKKDFTDLLKAAEADEGFKIIFHKKDED